MNIIAIDLKSFYASVECRERNRDPLTTNLVVADESRTEKTICLAVSPSLKSYGIPGRARLLSSAAICFLKYFLHSIRLGIFDKAITDIDSSDIVGFSSHGRINNNMLYTCF